MAWYESCIANETSLSAFQSLYMALAINLTGERGLSNEARCELVTIEKE